MTRYTYSIICEDVRQELSGKSSLMGVFPGVMFFPRFPAMIQGMCILINVVTPADQPFKNVSIRGSHSGEDLFFMTMDEEVMERHSNSTTKMPKKRFDKIQAMAKLSHVLFEAPGTLEIEVIADGVLIPGPGFTVMQSDEPNDSA